jgi:hypothetical protein
MNRLIEDEFPLREAQGMRYDLLGMLTDEDLAYRLPGDNVTLGELCREMGEIEHHYIESFRTFTYAASYRNNDPQITTSVRRLEAWYLALDEDLESVVQAFSDEDLSVRTIDRGRGFTPSLYVQFQIFHEAVLMFYAKASIYLKALRKPLSEEWRLGVG